MQIAFTYACRKVEKLLSQTIIRQGPSVLKLHVESTIQYVLCCQSLLLLSLDLMFLRLIPVVSISSCSLFLVEYEYVNCLQKQ